MQTAKIKVHKQYALKRADGLVRFEVTSIVTYRTVTETRNEIRGYVVEDQKPGAEPAVIALDPERLIGPYEEQAELVKRAAAAEAEQKAKQEALHKQTLADRLMLYRFVGVEAPQNAGEYNQLFRVMYRSVDIRSDGDAAIIARVRELEKMQLPELKPLPAGELLRIVKGE